VEDAAGEDALDARESLSESSDGHAADGGRIVRLESEVAALRGEVAELKSQLAQFRKQCE
jgi:hypothetical protein